MPSMGRCRCDSWRQADASTVKRACRTATGEQVVLQADVRGQAKITFMRTGYVVYPQTSHPTRERWEESRVTPEQRLAEAKADADDELSRRFCRAPHRGGGVGGVRRRQRRR